MKRPRVSIVIPTHNRREKLQDLLGGLRRQSIPRAEYEIIVVDDGSSPPVVLDTEEQGPTCSLIRLDGVERSAARNAGAAAARGDLLIFLDDDLAIPPNFLKAHLCASAQWSGALQVGAIRLPAEVMKTPFGRFRQRLEDKEVPKSKGPISARNFCTAQNMAIDRATFQRLGGFEVTIISGEDQDFAIRHTAAGGVIVFVPDAVATHHDSAFDIRSYCRRTQWGSENVIPLCRRYPEWPDNVARERINGLHKLGRHSVREGLRKMLKALFATAPIKTGFFCLAEVLEWIAPNSRLLAWTYQLLVGIHIFHGYRVGLKRFERSGSSSAIRVHGSLVRPIVE